MRDDALDALLWELLADDILREMLRATPAVPAFAAPTVPPPARRS